MNEKLPFAAYVTAGVTGLAFSLVLFSATDQMRFGSPNISGQLIAFKDSLQTYTGSTVVDTQTQANTAVAEQAGSAGYGWWIGVIVASIIFARVILKFAKRLTR